MSDPEYPDYETNYPPMDGIWVSDTNFDLGWIAGLHKVANKSITKIYGNYDEFKLNGEDLLDFSELDPKSFATDSAGPIIYISIFSLLFVVLLIWSTCWCCVNKCCCCCRSSFKGRNGKSADDFDNNQLRPYYSERNEKKFGNTSVGAIGLSILMAVWLIVLLIIILHAFASNDKTKEGINRIQPDLNSAIGDLNVYIGKTTAQLSYSFKDSFGMLSDKIMGIVDTYCLPLVEPEKCKEVKKEFVESVEVALSSTSDYLLKTFDDLEGAVIVLQSDMNEAKDQLDEDYADIIKNINDGLHWFFMLFNVVYCIIFGLVLVGTVLATFGRSNGLKTTGYLLIRGAIVLMFIAAIFAIMELIIMFLAAGVSSRIICPEIRSLELDENDIPPSTNEQPFNIKALINESGVFKVRQADEEEYKVPTVGQILRSCKNNQSAYQAFDLATVYDVNNLVEIRQKFENTLKPPPDLDPVVEKILNQVDKYIEFVKLATKNRLGQCEPVYKAINATVSLFCDKMTAPIASFWWILQFIPITFVMIVITAMFFERFHF